MCRNSHVITRTLYTKRTELCFLSNHGCMGFTAWFDIQSKSCLNIFRKLYIQLFLDVRSTKLCTHAPFFENYMSTIRNCASHVTSVFGLRVQCDYIWWKKNVRYLFIFFTFDTSILQSLTVDAQRWCSCAYQVGFAIHFRNFLNVWDSFNYSNYGRCGWMKCALNLRTIEICFDMHRRWTGLWEE